jgi:hypothetical protein
MNGSGNAAETCSTGVVGPAQSKVIHPPGLGRSCDGNIDADFVEVLECIVKSDRNELALETSKSLACRDGNILDSNLLIETACLVELVSSEGEVAGRTKRVTTKRSTVHIEAETTSQAMITIANITRISILSSIGSSHGIGAIDVEVWNELYQKRRRGGDIRLSWWRADCKSVGEFELMVRVEDWLRFNITGTLIADTQGRNVIELQEISSACYTEGRCLRLM